MGANSETFAMVHDSVRPFIRVAVAQVKLLVSPPLACRSTPLFTRSATPECYLSYSVNEL